MYAGPQTVKEERHARTQRGISVRQNNFEVVSFADNQCLLELTHQGPVGDGGESKWMPTSKKVYWPPTGTAAAGAAASQQSHNGHQPNQSNQPLNPLLPGAKSEAGSVISAHSGKKEKKVGEESKLH